jgi:hypothetical protein
MAGTLTGIGVFFERFVLQPLEWLRVRPWGMTAGRG